MGDKPLDPKVMKKTQDTLGKIIKKPPLTEKLLSKPPFKFLHDIMTSVIKTTGFMEGLFTDAEMDSENVKDKETKVAFLQKVIDMVSLVTGRPIAAKPTKIVAGHEPDRTNELLQALADSINKKVDNADYVKQVLKSDDSVSSKKERDSSKAKDKEDGSRDDARKSRDKREESADKDREKDKGRSERHKNRDKERSRDRSKENEDQNIERDSRHKDREERHKNKEEGGHGDSERSKDKHRTRSKTGDKERDDSKDKDRHKDDGKEGRKSKHREKDGEERKDRPRDKESSDKHRSKDRGDDKEKSRKDRHERDKDKRDHSRDEDERSAKKSDQDRLQGETEQSLQRPSSAKGQRKRQGKDDTKGERHSEESKLSASRKAPARPSSARPAPPKPKQRNGVNSDEVAVSSGLRRPNVIIDKDDDSDDNDFVTQEEDMLPPHADLTPSQDKANENEEGDGDHGGLVKKILETKKDYESTAQPVRKTEIDRTQAITDASRRKERELVQKEIDRLRASIQTLTRSVNPLGKILDFLQEDLDSMQKELEMYQNENKENTVILQREQSLTDTALLPLKSQLQELESTISDQVDLIAAAKATIGYNDTKISKILSSMTAKS